MPCPNNTTRSMRSSPVSIPKDNHNPMQKNRTNHYRLTREDKKNLILGILGGIMLSFLVLPSLFDLIFLTFFKS